MNVYGPTENTTFSTSYRVTGPYAGESIPIGKPLGNRSVYIVGRGGALAPLGVAGEICVGGDGVARGYWGLEALTEERFVPDPYSGRAGARMYRTGDLGRWLPDGNIEYMGRSDEQVKIHGNRIEPGEIDHVLLESGLVRQAVVVARADARGMLRLIGYVVAEGSLDKGRLVEYLKGRLPAYMVPVVWVELAELPLNSNGKVDKRLLPDVGNETGEGYEAPRTEVEHLLADIWGEVLGLERVGVRDNFFDLGGNSLVMLPLLSKIREVSARVSLKDLFVHQTIELLAAWMDKDTDKGSRRDTGPAPGGHLIPLHEGDSGATLFIVPGSQGFSDGYDELAKAFGDRSAVYGIQMMGSREGEEPIRDIPGIARQNIQWIKTVQPDGPYRFVAHCFGAHVAYEMTRQLECVGEKVAFTALLDISVDLDRLGITGAAIPPGCMMATLRHLLYAFGFTALGSLLITILTVSFQAIKAALANPVKSLRSE